MRLGRRLYFGNTLEVIIRTTSLHTWATLCEISGTTTRSGSILSISGITTINQNGTTQQIMKNFMICRMILKKTSTSTMILSLLKLRRILVKCSDLAGGIITRHISFSKYIYLNLFKIAFEPDFKAVRVWVAHPKRLDQKDSGQFLKMQNLIQMSSYQISKKQNAFSLQRMQCLHRMFSFHWACTVPSSLYNLKRVTLLFSLDSSPGDDAFMLSFSVTRGNVNFPNSTAQCQPQLVIISILFCITSSGI